MGVTTSVLQSNSALFLSILGILGALSGVLITNYYNSKNNDKKINFDLLDKDRERKFNLRKEIYLEAVDSIVEFEALLGGVAAAKNLDEFNAFHREQSKKLKKLELISDMGISIKVADLSAHFRYLINFILTEKTHLINDENDLNEIIEKIKLMDEKIEWFERGGSAYYNKQASGEAQREYSEIMNAREILKGEANRQFKKLFSQQEVLAVSLLEYFDNIAELIGTIYKGFRTDFGLDMFDGSRHDLSNQIKLKNKINENYEKTMKGIRDKVSSL